MKISLLWTSFAIGSKSGLCFGFDSGQTRTFFPSINLTKFLFSNIVMHQNGVPSNQFDEISFFNTLSDIRTLCPVINLTRFLPCPFTGHKMFCASPKNYVHFVPVQNILCHIKRWFLFSKFGFFAGTKVFEEALSNWN